MGDAVLPACCAPSEGAEPAEVLYCAYQAGGPPERAGLAWDGKPCPTWAELLARQDVGSAAVVSKWRAVAEALGGHLNWTAEEIAGVKP
jgi:hypothetical protein